jgi:hypothetical protein
VYDVNALKKLIAKILKKKNDFLIKKKRKVAELNKNA